MDTAGGGVDSGRGIDTFICMGLPITHLDLDALCDGISDCDNGGDETTALCESECVQLMGSSKWE